MRFTAKVTKPKRDPKDMKKVRQRRKEALNKLGFENMGDLVKWVEEAHDGEVEIVNTIFTAYKNDIDMTVYDDAHEKYWRMWGGYKKQMYVSKKTIEELNKINPL